MEYNRPEKYTEDFSYDLRDDFMVLIENRVLRKHSIIKSMQPTGLHHRQALFYCWKVKQIGKHHLLNRKGIEKEENVPSSCYTPHTIDSLSYTYMPNSNKLEMITDKAPCQDVLYLPNNIDRDVSYAANQVILTI